MAAEVRLAVRPAEHLVVRREDVHLAGRADPELHARAPEVVAQDPLLDDPAQTVERGEVLLGTQLLVFELECLHPLRERRRPSAPATWTSAFPSPLTPRFSLTTTSRTSGRPARISSIAPTTSSPPSTSNPNGKRNVLVREHAPAARFVPRYSSAGSAPKSGIPSRTASSTSSGEVLNGSRSAMSGFAISPWIRSIAPRRSSSFARQRPVRPVDERDDVEAATRLGRVELGHEAEEVVDDPRQDRLRGDVDHARARAAQQADQQAEEPLLVRGEGRD